MTAPRSRRLVAFAALAVIVLVAVVGTLLLRGGTATTRITQRCGPEEQMPIQGGEHLIGDGEPPVPYSSQPPTSGWHASGAFEIAVQPADEPLSEPRQVSVLESGGVVVAYRDLPEPERQALERLVRERFPGRAAVTPYEPLAPGSVAMAAWGVLQRCDGYDEEAVAAFVEAHADAQPDTPGLH